MLNKLYSIILPLIILISISPGFLSAQNANDYVLPKSILTEIARIKYTYKILDKVSDSIWPGWNNYREFPFLLSFENGLKVLIGHPSPPDGFYEIDQELEFNKTVFVNTLKLDDTNIDIPLICGGGIIPYGPQGKTVRTLNMRLTKASNSNGETQIEARGESRILVYIHELFHCFAFDNIPLYYGNLLFNANSNYAIYSDIEGQALFEAFNNQDDNKTIHAIKDFLIARQIKTSQMKAYQIAQASCDELNEGLAEYSELKTLQILSENPIQGQLFSQDTLFENFSNTDLFFKKYLHRLREVCHETFNSGLKIYDYGAFQALLLDRYYPDWKLKFKQENYLDNLLLERFTITKPDSQNHVSQFEDKYDLAHITSVHTNQIHQRNELYRKMSSMDGTTYIISFKETGQYLFGITNDTIRNYQLGDSFLYPEGIGSLEINGVNISFEKTPVEINRLFYIKVVDSTHYPKDEYSLTYSKQVHDVFYNACLKTNLFSIMAPRIKVQKRNTRVKIFIL